MHVYYVMREYVKTTRPAVHEEHCLEKKHGAYDSTAMDMYNTLRTGLHTTFGFNSSKRLTTINRGAAAGRCFVFFNTSIVGSIQTYAVWGVQTR